VIFTTNSPRSLTKNRADETQMV